MKLVTLRMRWSVLGPAPSVGQFLKSPRGRVAYEIVSMKERDRVKGKPRAFMLKCRRWEPREVPKEATCWEFFWDKRERRRRR